ncbi:EF-hand domain-containing family member C2-like [Argiope bruennichi]|uniref:EF-hand domain-containing family member C2-like n=1 Tax=Argiope bruennichi TaxID=94029 RepID=UPI002494F88A|nr:EF-hand domain-containing family member C2-like [Argiope bruennichi]
MVMESNPHFEWIASEDQVTYLKKILLRNLKPVPRKEEEVFHTHKLLYKHEEFGQPEQTLRTNDPFKPRADNVDLLKSGYKVRQLKFLARVITEDPVEKLRRYLVCFFMEDDTMAIKGLDPDHQNKSAMEHAHLKRMKVVKPHSTYWNSGRNFYEPVDFYVGGVIYVRNKPLELLEADEYTYDYMEQHCDQFPHANVRKIMTEFKEWITPKCGSLKSGFERYDPCKTGLINYEHFRNVLYEEMPSEIKNHYPEHAMKTVGRYYAEEKYNGLCFSELLGRAQSELYRKKFYDFEDLKLAFKIHDSEKFPKKENKINYLDLVEKLNWVENPTQFDKSEPQAIQINWERNETEKDLEKIKYNCFMMDIVSS